MRGEGTVRESPNSWGSPWTLNSISITKVMAPGGFSLGERKTKTSPEDDMGPFVGDGQISVVGVLRLKSYGFTIRPHPQHRIRADQCKR